MGVKPDPEWIELLEKLHDTLPRRSCPKDTPLCYGIGWYPTTKGTTPCECKYEDKKDNEPLAFWRCTVDVVALLQSRGLLPAPPCGFDKCTACWMVRDGWYEMLIVSRIHELEPPESAIVHRTLLTLSGEE